MKNSKLLMFVLMAFLATGCSLDASILDINTPEIEKIISFEKPSGAEFVSGAMDKYEDTPLRHYKVQASVGHFISEPRIKTPGRGYLVYSSVQGNMLSEPAQ